MNRSSSANWKQYAMALVVAAFCVYLGYFASSLRPASAAGRPVDFEIKAGQGFDEIGNNLQAAGLIRSSAVFNAYAVLNGTALRLKPGLYSIDPAWSMPVILEKLTAGASQEAEVVIPEGATIYAADEILSRAGIIGPGQLISFPLALSASDFLVEGRLFPDKYRFFLKTPVGDVVNKMILNFQTKAGPLLAGLSNQEAREKIILASILEKEVTDEKDRKIVAGILEKRLKAGMPLQVDATVCYAKSIAAASAVPCYPLSKIDFQINSPYNTYLNKGLPPGPIGNPGVDAIQAALAAQSSPYWFYLSDPRTGKTIFSRTLDEQEANRVKYLKS